MKDVQIRVNEYYTRIGVEGAGEEVLRRQAVTLSQYGDTLNAQGELKSALDNQRPPAELGV